MQRHVFYNLKKAPLVALITVASWCSGICSDCHTGPTDAVCVIWFHHVRIRLSAQVWYTVFVYEGNQTTSGLFFIP